MTQRTGPPAVVGLQREREVLSVALAAGRHVVIEGPPGTGKSTLLRDIARESGTVVVFAEGNAELTPARLIGQYDPAQVLAEGYVAASFTDGPLLAAMRSARATDRELRAAARRLRAGLRAAGAGRRPAGPARARRHRPGGRAPRGGCPAGRRDRRRAGGPAAVGLPAHGGDPALALTGISRLHVFCPLPTAESELAATALARRGHGVSQPLRTLADVAPALTRVLS